MTRGTDPGSSPGAAPVDDDIVFVVSPFTQWEKGKACTATIIARPFDAEYNGNLTKRNVSCSKAPHARFRIQAFAGQSVAGKNIE
jgi:hypothetical protein